MLVLVGGPCVLNLAARTDAGSPKSSGRDRYLYLCSMSAWAGSDGANTCMTLVCDYSARNQNDRVSVFVPLHARMGDVVGYHAFWTEMPMWRLWRALPDSQQLCRSFPESLPPSWVKPHVKVVAE